MTVKQLLANMDAGEFTEWQAFFSIEAEDRERPDSSEAVSENIKAALGV